MTEYPVIMTTLQEETTLYIPDPDQVKPVYEQNLLEDPETPFPFWAKIWASSLALTSFLKNNQEWVKGKRVLEIGAGIGLPSFSIAHLAESVVISDHAAAAVELMEKNIRHLGLENITALCLDWNHFHGEIKAEVVLLSDINYAPEQFDPLLKLIQRFLAERSLVIIATPQRIMGVPFVEKLSCYIINRTEENIIEQETEVEISILTLQHLPAEENDRRE
jgi:predicted nicotinamide N-methyase